MAVPLDTSAEAAQLHEESYRQLDTAYIERWVEELGLQQQWVAARNKVV